MLPSGYPRSPPAAHASPANAGPRSGVVLFPGFLPTSVPPGPVLQSRRVQVVPVAAGPPSSPQQAHAVPGPVMLPLPQHKAAQYHPQSGHSAPSPTSSHSPASSPQSAVIAHSAQHSPKPAPAQAKAHVKAVPEQRIFHHARSRSEGWRQHVAPVAAPPAQAVYEASPAERRGSKAQEEAKGSGQAIVAGRTFILDGILGKGSFGTVYRAYEEGAEGLKAAVKEIRCRSEKECRQAEYEATLMKRLSAEHICARRRRPEEEGLGRVVCCPALLSHQVVATGPNQWTVTIAMERVPGIPLDDFTKEPANRLPYREGVKLCRELLEQLCPTLEQVAPHCVHRDINAHNILLDMPSSSSSAPSRKPRFTLIDFGLATETSGWRAGDWKTKDIGGDCRYWPVSCWKLFLFGFKYLLADKQLTSEYINSLDVHSLVLTSIQLLVEVARGRFAEEARVLETAWSAYWEDAMRFWKQLYACFKNGGEWNALKSAFLQQQVAETTGRNLENLRAAVTACAAVEREASASALFRTLSRMLDGESVEWADLSALLRSTERADPAAQAPRKFMHHRTRTIDQAMTRDVPDLGAARFCAEALDAPSPEKARALALSPQRAHNSALLTGGPKLNDGLGALRGPEERRLQFGAPAQSRVLRKVTEEFRNFDD